MANIKKQFADYKGVMRDAPKQRKYKVVIDGFDDTINWSYSSGIHRVNYGLQSKEFQNKYEALDEYSACFMHYLESECMFLEDY